jgi:hypothetical protein
MNVAALIIGIDGWQEFTLPLMDSLFKHEPSVRQVVIDNASKKPYPLHPEITRTERLCYAAAINRAKEIAGNADWYIVLSNDVLCTGPFVGWLSYLSDCVAGPQFKRANGWPYIEGWCVCIPGNVWASVGEWDELFRISSWEDVDFSVSAVERGFQLRHLPNFPFVHLDQQQRFTIVPDYWQSEVDNVQYFIRKHAGVMA